MGQHVNSQVLDATKASHCTGSVSRRSRAATPREEDRTQVRTDKSSEESTAASTSISVKSAGQGRKEQTYDGRTNTCKSRKEHTQPQGRARVKENTRTLSTASTGRGPEQGQDENQNKFKMSVGMKITSCANNTNNEYLTTMTVKDIRGRLDKIPETGFDVMCG